MANKQAKMKKVKAVKKEIEIRAPLAFMEAAGKTNSCSSIGASESLRSTFGYNGYDYVCVSSTHQHDKTQRVDAYRVVPESEFKGKTLSYMERYLNGGQWTYEGLRVRLKGEWMVLTRKIAFILDEKAEEPCTIGSSVTVKAPKGKKALEMF